eukprot:gene46555-47569_t
MATAAGEGQRSISLYFRPADLPSTNAEVHDIQRQGPQPKLLRQWPLPVPVEPGVVRLTRKAFQTRASWAATCA